MKDGMDDGRWTIAKNRLRPHHPSTCFILLLATLAGCQVVGAVAYKVAPPPTQPAQYTPPQEPMLILAENYKNPSAAAVGSQQLSAKLADELAAHKVAPIVPADKLYAARDADPDKFEQMTIPQVGAATGAKQVLYLDIQKLGLDETGTLARGVAEMKVRVIDVETGQTRWPKDQADGYPISIETKQTELQNPDDSRSVETALTDQVVDQVAKLFYSYQLDE